MGQIKLTFVASVEEDLRLFRHYSKMGSYDTGLNNFAEFLGYLREELEDKIKGKAIEEQEAIVKVVLEREHKKHEKIINHNLKVIEEDWKNIGPKFIEECEKRFDGHPFPQDEYKAVQSIWGRFPYSREERWFAFPSNTPLMVFVVIHELLHFMFFDYIEKNFKGQLDKDNLWKLSEILNPILMNKKPFISWAKHPSQPYPSHKEDYGELAKVYEESKTMRGFIEKAVELLSS